MVAGRPRPSSSSSSSSATPAGGGSTAATKKSSSSSSAVKRQATKAGSTSRSEKRAAPAKERDRKLRETVSNASGCLDDLSTAQRKVLSARAGLGSAPPRSRTAVARRFDISVKRVVRLEKTGLKKLRSLAGNGGCAPPTTSDTVESGATAPGTAAAAMTGGAGGDGTNGRSGAGGGDGSGGEAGGRRERLRQRPRRRQGDPPAGGVDSAPGKNRGGVAGVTQTNPAGGSSAAWLIPLILLALLLTAILFTRLRRREQQPVPVTHGDPEPEPEPQRAPWVPWHKSTMTGPGWNDPPPGLEPEEAPPAAEEHEPWSPPRSRTRR